MKGDNQLISGGALLLILGTAAFVLPLLDRELIILAWLGSMEQPVGLSAMIVGGVLLAIGKLREFRNSSPVPSPTDPAAQAPVAGPAAEAEPEHPADPR
jgi:hypothetical protein